MKRIIRCPVADGLRVTGKYVYRLVDDKWVLFNIVLGWRPLRKDIHIEFRNPETGVLTYYRFPVK